MREEKEYLMDTCILSQLISPGERQDKISDWILNHPGKISTSVIVGYEIRSGLLAKNFLKRLNIFENMLLDFDIAIYPVDEEIAQKAANLRAKFMKSGLSYSLSDLLIGSTVLIKDAILLTDNEKDFRMWIPNMINPLFK